MLEVDMLLCVVFVYEGGIFGFWVEIRPVSWDRVSKLRLSRRSHVGRVGSRRWVRWMSGISREVNMILSRVLV